MKINNFLRDISTVALEQFNALTQSKTATQTLSQNTFLGDNAAIEHLSNRVAEQNQTLQVQDANVNLSQPVAVDFKTDFGDKAPKDITQADVMTVFYRKLGTHAGLVEPRLGEFVNAQMANKNGDKLYHLDKNGKPAKPYDAKEFAALKKNGVSDITPSQNTLVQLRQVKSNQTADVLLAKYQTPFGLDEKGLGKELAGLANNDLGAVKEVLSQLKQNDFLINQGQTSRVANQMISCMSENDLLLLAQKRKGDKFLKELNDDFKNNQTFSTDAFLTLQSQTQIETVRAKAKAVLLGDNTASLSDWEKTGVQSDATLDRLRVSDADKDKAREIFNRLYPNQKDNKIVAGSEEAEELNYLGKLVAQNKYNQAIDRAVAEVKADFPQLNEKTLKALLIQESGMSATPPPNGSFVGVAQMNPIAATTQGGITTNDRLDPEKAIPAAARILRAKAKSLESVKANWAFSKYGKPSEEDYIKFVVASYNAGEGRIAQAMDIAYEQGKSIAQERGLSGDEAEQFAKNYATKWDNLLNDQDPTQSPLYQAHPTDASRKYVEVRDYANRIYQLSRRQKQ